MSTQLGIKLHVFMFNIPGRHDCLCSVLEEEGEFEALILKKTETRCTHSFAIEQVV
jgi:hypothetical protein